MDADAFRARLEALHLTQGVAADWLGVGERTVRRWAVEGPPQSVAMLLRLMERFNLDPEDV